jgi:hypothetical protein
MTGFTEIEQPAVPFNGTGGIEQASADILDFMGQTVVPPVDQQEPAPDEPEAAEASAQEVVEERPEAQTSQGEVSEDLLAPEYLDRKVKFRENGEDVELTVKGLIEGFQVQSSNKRTSQELAQERQQLAAQFGEISNQREQYNQLLEQQRQQLEALIPKEPDWANLPQEEYRRMKPAWDHLQSQLSSVQQEQQRVFAEQQQTYQQQMGHYLQQQNQALLKANADLRDDSKRQDFFKGIAHYAQHEYNFSPQELAMVNDHRLWIIADKARRYDELQAGGKAKQGDTSIPTLRGGRSPDDKPSSRKLREARSAFTKTGDTRDAAKLIEQML